MADQRGEILKALGDAIRERRKELGLTIEALGERADLHYTYVAGVELGKRNPSTMTLFKFATGLDQPVSEILRAAEELLNK